MISSCLRSWTTSSASTVTSRNLRAELDATTSIASTTPATSATACATKATEPAHGPQAHVQRRAERSRRIAHPVLPYGSLPPKIATDPRSAPVASRQPSSYEIFPRSPRVGDERAKRAEWTCAATTESRSRLCHAGRTDGPVTPASSRAARIGRGRGATRSLKRVGSGRRSALRCPAAALEPSVERVFHPDSYEYRPGRSAHDAVAVCRERCRRQDWVSATRGPAGSVLLLVLAIAT